MSEERSKFQERNKLNSLSARDFSAFLSTVDDGAWINKEDVEHSIKVHSLPLATLSEIVSFFTKEGGSMLQVFCGIGRIGTALCASLGISYTGITLYQDEKDEFDRENNSTMFPGDGEIIVDEAISALETLGDQKFDFVFVNPSRFGTMPDRESVDSVDLGRMGRVEYIQYLATTIDMAAAHLKEDGYLVAAIDDQYVNGEYVAAGYEVIQSLRATTLKGVKYYRFPRNGSSRGNLGRYVPSINHNPVYILKPS